MDPLALTGAALVFAALLYVVWDLGIGTEPDDGPAICPHQDQTYSFTTGVTRCLTCGEITEQEHLD